MTMKKTFAALTLATIMMFGTTFSFADGIIISDAANSSACTAADKDGIIIFGREDGIIIFGITIIAGENTPPACERDGIIITD